MGEELKNIPDTGSQDAMLKDFNPASKGTPYPGMVMNLAEPIRLAKLEICGFSAETQKPGTTSIQIIQSAALTSDEPAFHKIVNGMKGVLAADPNFQGRSIERYNDCLIIIHADQTAEIYLDIAAKSHIIVMKRPIESGRVVFQSDIADMRGIRFPAISFSPQDKVFYCFRVDWKFGLFFDFRNNHDFDVSLMEEVLGHLYRKIHYQAIYDALADENTFKNLITAGWFPFVEILNTEFNPILHLAIEGYDLATGETALISKFTDARIDRMTARWWLHPIMVLHREVLESGIAAFKRNDSVACLKIFLTEIEGILQNAHISSEGKNAKIPALVNFAASQGKKRANGDQTLFFPRQFALYLERFTYSDFDPMQPSSTHVSRHSVGHGSATAAAYTQARALQALLTIDQIAFFL